MKYKKGKPFESAVEMFEWCYDRKKLWCNIHNVVITDSSSSIPINDTKAFWEYSQAIEEKEDEVREFWNYYYLIGKVWSRTSNFYDGNYENTSGFSSVILSKAEKTIKIESSKIRVNMRTLEIVE